MSAGVWRRLGLVGEKAVPSPQPSPAQTGMEGSRAWGGSEDTQGWTQPLTHWSALGLSHLQPRGQAEVHC